MSGIRLLEKRLICLSKFKLMLKGNCLINGIRFIIGWYKAYFEPIILALD